MHIYSFYSIIGYFEVFADVRNTLCCVYGRNAELILVLLKTAPLGGGSVSEYHTNKR